MSKCSTIRRSPYLSVKKTSKDCFNTELDVGDMCSFECAPGFKLSRPIIECRPGNLATGSWSVDINKDFPTCTGNC